MHDDTTVGDIISVEEPHAEQIARLKADNARLAAECAAMREAALAALDYEETADSGCSRPWEEAMRAALSSPSPEVALYEKGMALAEAAIALSGFNAAAPEGQKITCVLCGRPRSAEAPGCEWHRLRAEYIAASKGEPRDG